MNDVTQTVSLPQSWQLAARQMTQLFRQLPLPHHSSLLVVLPEAEAYETLRVAASALGLRMVAMPAHSTQAGVARAIAQTKPCVVVCTPEVFGWVSKLAFLGGCLAIYTCGAEGEGTLLDRAFHCSEALPAAARTQIPPPMMKLDGDGLPSA